MVNISALLHPSSFTLFVLHFLQPIYAPPSINRTPIDLDISGPISYMIDALPSDEVSGGTSYAVRAGYRHSFVMGKVVDAEEMLVEESKDYVSRYVLFVPRNGSRYIRITTKFRNGGKYLTRIQELLKRPGDAVYNAITRSSIDLDVLVQKSTNFVNAELILPPEIESGGIEDVLENLEIWPVKYSVQKELQDEIVIGKVLYGGKVFETKIDGLIFREVLWEGGLDAPIITILSRYKNGMWTEKKYLFEKGDNNGFTVFNARSGHLHESSP